MNGLVAEYMPHKGTIAMFPSRNDIWRENAKHMQQYICDLVTISHYESVYFFSEPRFGHQLIDKYKSNKNVEIIPAEYDDIWARDIGPSFVKTNHGMTCVDWRFNAWGGKKEGSYYPWDKDDAFALFASSYLGLEAIRTSIVVEGGGIITDGVGTIFTTRSVLMNRNRNPFKKQKEIEIQLLESTGAKRIVWLDQGLALDETNGHIDNVLSCISPKDICLAWTDDKSNPNYKRLHKIYRMLGGMKNLTGELYKIHRIPLPDMLYMTEEEEKSLRKDENALERKAGDVLPASYLNFYMLNGAVLIPSFDCVTDTVVLKIFKELFPDREVVQVYSREPLLGGGGIHCLLHEVPEFKGEPSVKSVLSRKVEVRASKIHDQGMYAKEPIKKGEIVFIKGGHILSRKEYITSSVINSYQPIFGDYVVGARNTEEEKIIKLHNNHSCDPNCGMDGEITFVAIRDVAMGEELTVDYAFLDNEDYSFECHCGSPKCRHIITGFDWKIKRLQDEYYPYFAKYLKEKIDKMRAKEMHKSSKKQS